MIQEDFYDYLIVTNKEKNSFQNTPLHLSAYKGNLEVSRYLLQIAVEVNPKNSQKVNRF